MPQYQEPAGVIHSVLKTDAGDAFHKELAGKNGRLHQPSADARRELVDARSKNVCPSSFRQQFICLCFVCLCLYASVRDCLQLDFGLVQLLG